MNSIQSVSSSLVSIEGGASVLDKASGLAKAIFLNRKNASGHPLFEILVNDKRLIYPANLDNVLWFGSKLFTFERVQSTFLSITEEDATGNTNIVYVELKPDEFYIMHKCLPKHLTEEEALNKIKGIVCKPSCLLYNELGVALLAVGLYYYDVYFAYPNQDTVKKVSCLSSYSNVDGVFDFTSRDLFIYLEMNRKGDVFVNRKKASKITLNSNLQPQAIP